MAAPRESQPRTRRYSVRYQARLDAETSANLEGLARTFHRKRAAILRHMMQWGLTQIEEGTIDMAVPGTVRTLSLLLEPELLQQVQEAAAAHGASVAVWVRYVLRQVTPDDFPTSWHAEASQEGRPRSHDSQQYRIRFMLRLDKITAQKLQQLVEQVGRTQSEIIRQFIAQVTPEDCPQSWT
jgi:predicted DNA-binding protein